MTFTASTATSFGPAAGEGPDAWQSAKPRADVADFDNDGRLDIIKTQFPSNIGLWRNTVDTEGNRWMKVRVRGGGGNSDGVGASVRWYRPGTSQLVTHLDVAVDRKSVVEGKSVSVRVDLGGGRIINKKTLRKSIEQTQIGYTT